MSIKDNISQIETKAIRLSLAKAIKQKEVKVYTPTGNFKVIVSPIRLIKRNLKKEHGLVLPLPKITKILFKLTGEENARKTYYVKETKVRVRGLKAPQSKIDKLIAELEDYENEQ